MEGLAQLNLKLSQLIPAAAVSLCGETNNNTFTRQQCAYTRLHFSH
jgi:hypothetical protein